MIEEASFTKSLEEMLEEVTSSILSDEPLNKKDFSSEDLTLLYSIASGLYQAGDYDQARTIFTQLIVSKPIEPSHWQGLAATLQMKKEYEQAVTAWAMTALLSPEDPFPHFHAAECLISLEKADEALKALAEAKQLLKSETKHTTLKKQIELIESQWTRSGR